MSNNWNPEQTAAIESRGCALLVAAAAGSGKTAVLVERIISRLLDQQHPANIDQLLVVTFTKAAAGEMKDRIRQRLIDELKQNPASRPIQRQLLLLNQAEISTLHSFCHEMVRRYFYLLDIDPGFRVADPGEAALLQLEVMDDVLEEWYQAGNAEFLDLVEAYGGERDDRGMISLVLRIHTFSRSHPNPGQWLERVAEQFEELGRQGQSDLNTLPWTAEIRAAINRRLQQAERQLQQALAISRRPDGPYTYIITLEDDLRLLSDLLAAASGSDLIKIENSFAAVQWGSLKPGSKKLAVDPALKKQAQDCRDKAKKQVKKIRETYFARPLAEQLAELAAIAPQMRALTKLVGEFDEKYRKRKIQRGLVDFEDLEHYCLRLLNHPQHPLAGELRQRYVEVLVDEYQDINPVQNAILEMVSRPPGNDPNLFVVGDVKQSIYRFRQADPGLFLGKYRNYPSQPGNSQLRLLLRTNYRSRPAVLKGINLLFRRIMTPTIGELAYDQEAELVPGAYFPDLAADQIGTPTIELIVIDRAETQAEAAAVLGEAEAEEQASFSGEDNGSDSDSGQVGEEVFRELNPEAAEVSRAIREMIDSGQKILDRDSGQYRPLAYRDIVILLRSPQALAPVFLEALQSAGIPATAELAGGFFDAPEVALLLALLQLLDNPRQDIPLVAVLRSPLVGLNAGQLAEIRCRKSGVEFFEAVRETAAGQDELANKTGTFLHWLDDLRTLARRDRISTVLWEVMHRTGYYDYVGAMPGGGQRQANLRLLQSWAAEYENTTFRGLADFLQFITLLQAGGSDIGLARTLSENEDVVRLMSIHRSKGLEFPVVIVAGLGRGFNPSDLKPDILLHRDWGIGPMVRDQQLPLKYYSLLWQAMRERLQREQLSEEMRLLYVAMTRAKEKLILAGTPKNPGKLRRQAEEINAQCPGVLPEAELSEARCFLDWIVPAVWPDLQAPNGVFVLRTAAAGGQAAANDRPATDLTWLQEQRELPATPAAEEVRRRLDWSYPCAQLSRLPAKLSVSRLSARGSEEGAALEPEPPLVEAPGPRFLQSMQGLSAAERGTAIHRVLQQLLPHGPTDPGQAMQQLFALTQRQIITPEQARAVDPQLLARFFASDLGVRLRAADPGDVWKELPFSLMLPAVEIYPELVSDCQERILVQGVIDCLLREGDRLVLIEFKTDWQGSGIADSRLQRYQTQIGLYRRAVEAILHQPVSEQYLVFLATGETIEVKGV